MAESGGSGPLHKLLYRIPLDAVGFVTLSDLNAARGQIAPFAAESAQFDRDLLPFTLIYPPNGFDANSLTSLENGALEMLGFSIFEIDQLAGWGNLPIAPVIVTGVADLAAGIEAALQARNFETTDYQGHKVWHRQDDFQMNFKHRNEEPFGGQLGTSQRFSIDGNDLLFARSWPSIHRLLDGGPSLADDPDSTAILHAGYSLPDNGSLIDAVLIFGQPIRQGDATPVIETGKKSNSDAFDNIQTGLPPFTRYGLLLWQDGASLTGAIAIPYPNAEIATSALNLFTQFLDTTNAPSVDRPFAELLPADRRFEVIDTGSRHVLIVGFRQSVEIERPPKITTFMRNPRQRLIDMLMRRELDFLIGASP